MSEIYWRTYNTLLSILTVMFTIWHSVPFSEWSLRQILMLLLRSVGSTITLSSDVDNLTSYERGDKSVALNIFLITPYWLCFPTKTGVSVSRVWFEDVSLILFNFKLWNLIIFYVWEVFANICSSFIFLGSFSSLIVGS